MKPQQADALWYGLRPSSECVYCDLKSDGWQWQNTRLLDPQRAERLWLAMAVATLWMVIPSGEAENQSSLAQFRVTSPQHTVFSQTLKLNPFRQISCFLLGSLTRRC
ncbi:hypothetical protein [Microcystis aeruginosa]|uniref:hypothetical protein n=1 Tax=Microcystis aeruginosa TaxID=1126 RepID=UPI001E4C6A8E|nr:hypothetical protein [Microcystis aeruginosa]